jgi:uncharacterized protein YerC
MSYIIPSDELLANPHLKEIFKGLALLDNTQEVQKVLSDAFTEAELQFVIRRWQSIKMLALGDSYRKIAKELHISTSTVNRTAYSFYQERGGWRILLTKLGYIKD